MSDPFEPVTVPEWPTVAQYTLGSYKLFDLQRVTRRSPTTDRAHDFLRLETPDWVNVIAISESGELILVEQYRHGTNASTLEIPGGCVDADENPREAANRELEEETGYRAGKLHQLGVVEPNPAFLSNRCWTFLALDCRPSGTTSPDPSEEIRCRLVPASAFTRLIDQGLIRHALVIAAHDHLVRGLRRGEPWASAVPL